MTRTHIFLKKARWHMGLWSQHYMVEIGLWLSSLTCWVSSTPVRDSVSKVKKDSTGGATPKTVLWLPHRDTHTYTRAHIHTHTSSRQIHATTLMILRIPLVWTVQYRNVHSYRVGWQLPASNQRCEKMDHCMSWVQGWRGWGQKCSTIRSGDSYICFEYIKPTEWQLDGFRV